MLSMRPGSCGSRAVTGHTGGSLVQLGTMGNGSGWGRSCASDSIPSPRACAARTARPSTNGDVRHALDAAAGPRRPRLPDLGEPDARGGAGDPALAVVGRRGVLVESVSRGAPRRIQPQETKASPPPRRQSGGGRGALEASGVDVGAVIRAASPSRPSRTRGWAPLANDRSAKLDKLLTHAFRTSRGPLGCAWR
jgi:hypothetical protein